MNVLNVLNVYSSIMTSLFFALLHPSNRRFAASLSAGQPRLQRSLAFGRRGSLHSLALSASESVVVLSDDVPVYRSEGLFCVDKPLDWTSSDAVSFVRGILEGDARQRGGTVASVRSRNNNKKNGEKNSNSRKVRVGHGGTLDPLATGVLVIGVGRGTKELELYLKGAKEYTATGEFGFETTTLDMDPRGSIARNAPFDHITEESLKQILPAFRGKISQIPPIFSAIKKGGKRLYQSAREGKTEEDVVIEPREVVIDRLEVTSFDLPRFDITLECGGGTYVRSLIRDMARALDSVATTTVLRRTKQGPFTLEDAIPFYNWNSDTIYAAIDKFNAKSSLPQPPSRSTC